MTDSSGLEPRWASPPGETILTVLREREISLSRFAEEVNLSDAETSRLLSGDFSITLALARDISRTLGGATEFWMTREAQYRDDLVRLKTDRWAQQFPIKQMTKFGWIKTPRSWHDQMQYMLDFFGVGDIDDWESIYEVLLSDARFRGSESFEFDQAATSAWFRACERAADRIDGLKSFNSGKFERLLTRLRRLTKRKDPQDFISELVSSCASVGVAVVVVPAPTGCPASGAARAYKGRPLIQLSARHLSDDHFWFTFFHEAAHVIRHDLTAAFIDGMEFAIDEDTEREANEYASGVLFNSRWPSAADARAGRRRIISLAIENGVSPGVVVGYLQHNGYLPYSRLNSLKRRYVWKGTNLEMARRR